MPPGLQAGLSGIQRRRNIMASLLVRFAPRSLTVQQYEESVRRLQEAGYFPPEGLDYHVCFGNEGSLKVSEIWSSREAFDAFAELLMPILADVGIEAGAPEFFDIHNVVRQ